MPVKSLRNFLILTLVLLLMNNPTYMSAQDEYREARYKMVDTQIKARGIKDQDVLDAMYKVPRHLFVPENRQHEAYRDQAMGIGYKQTISQPYVVAFTLASLNLKPSDKVLEIGTGSGYLAAVVAEIVDTVVTIEIVEPLGQRATSLLEEMNYRNIKVIIGDGFHGHSECAPYDAIIVSAGAMEVPQPLLDQLKIGGQLIMPLGPQRGVQKLTLMTKKKDGFTERVLESVRFVPLTRKKNK